MFHTKFLRFLNQRIFRLYWVKTDFYQKYGSMSMVANILFSRSRKSQEKQQFLFFSQQYDMQTVLHLDNWYKNFKIFNLKQN